MIKPSEFNRRVTLKAYTYTHNDSGGITPVLAESVEVWAKVIQTTGGTGTQEAQQLSYNNYSVTLRYREGLTTNWLVFYEDQVFKINSISVSEEGYKRFMVLSCSTTIRQSDWS